GGDVFSAYATDSKGSVIFNGPLGVVSGPNISISKGFNWTANPAPGKISLTISSSYAPPKNFTGACGAGLNFTDGRCNQEPWQAFAVYPDDKGGYFFYALYNGAGYYAMHVTEQQLDDHP